MFSEMLNRPKRQSELDKIIAIAADVKKTATEIKAAIKVVPIGERHVDYVRNQEENKSEMTILEWENGITRLLEHVIVLCDSAVVCLKEGDVRQGVKQLKLANGHMHSAPLCYLLPKAEETPNNSPAP